VEKSRSYKQWKKEKIKSFRSYYFVFSYTIAVCKAQKIAELSLIDSWRRL